MNRTESGAVNVLLIVVVMVSLIAVGFAVAFFWAFNDRDHYKNDSDALVAAAVATAKSEAQKAFDTTVAEALKQPYVSFSGPADFGSVSFSYPRTWAGYNVENSANRYAVYYAPQVVPNTGNKASLFSLRVSIVNQTYETVLKSYESLAISGKVTVTPITTGTDGFGGMRVDGTFDDQFHGSAAIFKIRDKTLTLRTDSQDYMNDFNNVVLATLHFTP